ncbi:uncharacterized protein LOC115788702 [Archocentrus centrarchus]|uniref:uncharacterized protein LOC115788702 n=1 Tax=Archocentrus centrarchus TaxID=63155 RepID=UPI0011EA1D86|nr:uncharacterized protein LOC115788702 [Archocentrus centrarchus]
MALTGARLDCPNKMQNGDEKSAAEQSLTDLPLDPLSALFSSNTTCLAKIAIMLQYAPFKMLTFRQLKDKLSVIFKDGRLADNSIRWYLSGYKCFVRIPGILNRKAWYWMLDTSHITTEMVSEHFLEILHLFPGLACRLEKENPTRPSAPLHSPEPVPCSAFHIKPDVKFSGPFSIDSILKGDSTSAQAYRASPPSSLPFRVEHPFQLTQQQQPGTKRCFSWDSDEHFILKAGSSPVCTGGGRTHHGAITDGAAKPIKRIPMYPPPSFLVHPRASPAPFFTSPQSSGITYTVPALTHNVLHF